jgi:putative toxin-antitoxin system antitoxin component (TIGR02293 family)
MTPEQEDRLTRVKALALDVWQSSTAANHFLTEPHMLLRGRVPREMAIGSEDGARQVEQILGGLKYGTAV